MTDEICISFCQAFIHNDEEIQSKAAKLVVKYDKNNSAALAGELERYADSMLMSSKKLMEDLISVPDAVELQSHALVFQERGTLELLEEVQTLDELVFLASQAFDNNDPLHIDLFPAALIHLQEQVDGSQLHKFEPALQRAYSFVMNDWPSTMGYLDHLLATFFIDVTKIWIGRFPLEGASLQKVTSDKTVRSFAAESWISGVHQGKMDNARVGEIIGIHLASGYAPMKRFTDVVSENWLKISAAHNAALEKLITGVIEKLSSEAPTGLKRLLEIYSEILLTNGSSISSATTKQALTQWTSSASLKKIINTLVS